LVSFDFGYGIMQITSGMAGAFGDVKGTVDPGAQSQIASDYRYNIAYGAQLLVKKWITVPRIGDGDPSEVENWYYALWAYNGWGWVNNPNNPRFTRQGTPATNPNTFPYQERVLYLVAHPPKDRDGNPLWQPIPVTLPTRQQVGTSPVSFDPTDVHREVPSHLSAVYSSPALHPMPPATHQTVSLSVVNTGTEVWAAVDTEQVSLSYHLMTLEGNPWQALSPFAPGILAFGQGAVALPRDVVPGAEVKVRATIVAPQTVGRYRIVWDLQVGTLGWFSQLGSLPHAEILKVGPTATTTRSRQSPTPEPAEDARFVADTSIPDGTTLLPHQLFAKGWLVLNSGQVAWEKGFRLHLVSGPSFGHSTIEAPSTASCSTTNIVASLEAPGRPGAYKSVWQMQDPSGHRFGQSLTIVVAVQGRPPQGTPVPTPGAPVAFPTPSPTPTPQG